MLQKYSCSVFLHKVVYSFQIYGHLRKTVPVSWLYNHWKLTDYQQYTDFPVVSPIKLCFMWLPYHLSKAHIYAIVREPIRAHARGAIFYAYQSQGYKLNSESGSESRSVGLGLSRRPPSAGQAPLAPCVAA